MTINRNPSGVITPGQSGPGSDRNQGVPYIPQGSSITGSSPSDCWVNMKNIDTYFRWKVSQNFGKGTEEIGDRRNNWDSLYHSIVKIDWNPGKYLIHTRRFAVTHAQEKDLLKLMWKTGQIKDAVTTTVAVATAAHTATNSFNNKLSLLLLLREIFIFKSALADGFHLRLSDSKFPQVSRTLLSILADLNNAVLWIVSTRPLIFKSSNPFFNPLVTVPRATLAIGQKHHFHILGFLQFHSKDKVFILLFNFFLFYTGVSRDSKIHNFVTGLYFVDYYKVWSSGRGYVIRLYIKIPEDGVVVIRQDRC